MYSGPSGRFRPRRMLRPVLGDLVLIDDPFEGTAAAEAVVECLGRDAAKGQGRVDDEAALVLLGRTSLSGNRQACLRGRIELGVEAGGGAGVGLEGAAAGVASR